MPKKKHYLEFGAVLQLSHRDLFKKALDSGKCADVTFKVGDEERSVNGALLGFISPVFEVMLYGVMRKSRPDPSVPIEINHIEPETFDCIANFAYNNDPKITIKNIFSLILACQRYQIDSLYDSCIELLRTNLNRRNFCKYFRYAAAQSRFEEKSLKTMVEFFQRNYDQCLNGNNFCSFFEIVVNRIFTEKSYPEFMGKCMAFVDNASNDVAMTMLKSDGFLKMSMEGMQELLERSINCKEERIWDALLRWDQQQRHSHDDIDEKYDSDCLMDEDDRCTIRLKSVRHLIRFGLMDGAYFVDNVMDKGVLTDDEEKAVLLYYQAPQRGCGPFSTHSRCRFHSAELPFEISYLSQAVMSKGGDDLDTHNCAALGYDNLTTGCCIGPSVEPYLMAVFNDPVDVNEIKIAPCSGYGEYLKGVSIEAFQVGNWHRVKIANHASSNLDVAADVPGTIHTLKVSECAGIEKVRIQRSNGNKATFLILGYLRFFGQKA